METLIVVQSPRHWDFAIPDVRVVAAQDYLNDPAFSELRGARVYNLCRSYRYLSLGYYVSLLAEARGHRPLPAVNTIQDLRMPAVLQVASEELGDLVQRSLGRVRSERFTLSIYFGRNVAERHASLSLRLFNLFPAPLLRAQFVRRERWELQRLHTISSSEVPPSHRAFVEEAAGLYFAGRVTSRRRRKTFPYDLAIVVNPKDPKPPSNAQALRRFARAAESQGLKTTFVTRDDYGRVGEFDAVFLRDTTGVNHYTYRFASRAAAEGLVVIDDPVSIVRCTNKVYLAELLTRHRIATPGTVTVHAGNADQVAQTAKFPCILKRPDSSFSQGVFKVQDPAEFRERAQGMLRDSDLVLAQEYLPTPFDWRVGVLDREPLYVCRYWMAHRHWQIIHWDAKTGRGREGRGDTLAVQDAPPRVVRTAVRAANLVGDGLYGVDLKEVGRRVYVIEVNDNPTIDAGVEDKVLRNGLYERVMSVFRDRIDRQRHGKPTP